MSLLFKIVYAAHANGTHHKLALDALNRLERPDAEAWRRVFLKHAALYLEGSKAPDKEFKDFKNHVLHVQDRFWGGAPEKAQNWYGHTVEALQRRDFAQAVYAAGVLSHYVTDPIHPFHTAQSEAENNVHRAVEWSISKSYDALLGEANADAAPGHIFAKPDGANWLKALVCDAATLANADYVRLIAHYNLQIGVSDPQSGFDQVGRKAVGRLIVYAHKAFAHVLDRALSEAGVAAPEVALSAETVLAALTVPIAFVQKKLTDADTRRQVLAMYDELITTGKVDTTLPEDDRAVRDLYAAEVLAPAAQDARRQREARIAEPPRQARAAASPEVGTPAARSPVRALAELDRAGRAYLAAGDPVEAAPSIGPKMAARLGTHGIKTVADLLGADPADLAAALADARVSKDEIAAWQDQSRLVMQVAGLRGTHAQLICGAGYRSAADIAAVAPDAFAAALLKFAATPAGKRILRDGSAPDVERIKSWADAASRALAA